MQVQAAARGLGNFRDATNQRAHPGVAELNGKSLRRYQLEGSNLKESGADPEYRLLLQVALILCLLVVILVPLGCTPTVSRWPMLVGGVLSLIISFRLLSQLRLRLVRATFILPPDRVEFDRQAGKGARRHTAQERVSRD